MKAAFEQKRSFETNKGGHGFIWCINLLITAALLLPRTLSLVPLIFFNGVNKNKANTASFKTSPWINVLNSISTPLFGVYFPVWITYLISHHFLRNPFTENKILTAYVIFNVVSSRSNLQGGVFVSVSNCIVKALVPSQQLDGIGITLALPRLPLE